MKIYVKLQRKAELVNAKKITVGDVAEVFSPDIPTRQINKIRLADIDTSGGAKNIPVKITDVFKKISAAFPGASLQTVGESDAWVHCTFPKRKPNQLFMWLRVGFVSLVLLAGAATAIMSFHTDGQIPKIFERYYFMFYGTEMPNPPIIAIPYSIGLAVGIIVFYNHFMGKKITDDPTPIEVEIEQYEKEVNEAMIDMMERLRHPLPGDTSANSNTVLNPDKSSVKGHHDA